MANLNRGAFPLFVMNGLATHYFWEKHYRSGMERRKISGVFHDLGMDGALLLLDDSGHTHHITTGDVQLLDN